MDTTTPGACRVTLYTIITQAYLLNTVADGSAHLLDTVADLLEDTSAVASDGGRTSLDQTRGQVVSNGFGGLSDHSDGVSPDD